jgi:hypothetical protein
VIQDKIRKWVEKITYKYRDAYPHPSFKKKRVWYLPTNICEI